MYHHFHLRCTATRAGVRVIVEMITIIERNPLDAVIDTIAAVTTGSIWLTTWYIVTEVKKLLPCYGSCCSILLWQILFPHATNFNSLTWCKDLYTGCRFEIAGCKYFISLFSSFQAVRGDLTIDGPDHEMDFFLAISHTIVFWDLKKMVTIEQEFG